MVWADVIIMLYFSYSIFCPSNLDLEYEYVYVNGELDIDKIMSKSKKTFKIFDLTKLELIAPLNSHRMDYHNHNTNLKVLDYSSGKKDHKRFML